MQGEMIELNVLGKTHSMECELMISESGLKQIVDELNRH